MARKYTRSYPADFRPKIVELARSGRGIDELAREFKLAPQTVRNWIKIGDVNSGRRSDGLTTSERKELAKLRRAAHIARGFAMQCLQSGALDLPNRRDQVLSN